jgi:hypothetical protein
MRRSGQIPGARPAASSRFTATAGGARTGRTAASRFNRDIDDLFPRVAVGTPVTIVGDGQGVFARMFREHQANARNP